MLFLRHFFLLVSLVTIPIYAASANKVEKLNVSEQACVNERRFSKKKTVLNFLNMFLEIKKNKKKTKPFSHEIKPSFFMHKIDKKEDIQILDTRKALFIKSSDFSFLACCIKS